MDNFWPWLVVALIVGLMLWRQSKKQEVALTPDEIVPLLVEKISIPKNHNSFEEEMPKRLDEAGIKLMAVSDESTRFIFDQPRASWFHWGFFYTIEITKINEQELSLTAGIYPKGPNPPRGLRLKKHLDRFVALIAAE
ncbi:hypothetical protein F3F96_04705 [Mariprofundus sp. NF]|uniref:hypothetical protein n=1 Tax=Mariprofundus sp. NF TaxID=2608716 RepID=UPI0015A3C599|nr:hypothetical protein [Mariprofundus sp. NF]NWF38428.1 hypothetical protein [Mariprofundus sp. NF]